MNAEIRDSIYSDFESYMTDLLDRDSAYFNKNIHASSLTNCPRQVVYSYFDFPKKPWTLAEMIMLEFGNIAHGLVRRFLNKSDSFEVVSHEQRLTRYMPKGFAGKCDTIAVHKPTGALILVDVKSVRPNAFKYGQLVKPSYIVQLNAYRYAAEKKLNRKFDGMFILIIDRAGSNQPALEPVEVMPDSEMEAIFAKYKDAVERYEVGKELPPPISKADKKNAWQCGYCKYEGIVCGGAE